MPAILFNSCTHKTLLRGGNNNRHILFCRGSTTVGLWKKKGFFQGACCRLMACPRAVRSYFVTLWTRVRDGEKDNRMPCLLSEGQPGQSASSCKRGRSSPEDTPLFPPTWHSLPSHKLLRDLAVLGEALYCLLSHRVTVL